MNVPVGVAVSVPIGVGVKIAVGVGVAIIAGVKVGVAGGDVSVGWGAGVSVTSVERGMESRGAFRSRYLAYTQLSPCSVVTASQSPASFRPLTFTSLPVGKVANISFSMLGPLRRFRLGSAFTIRWFAEKGEGVV